MQATPDQRSLFVTMEVLGHTRFDRPCRGATCGQLLSWYQTHPNQKWIAFQASATPIETYPMSRRNWIAVMKTDDVHWKHCPNAKDFKRKKR